MASPRDQIIERLVSEYDVTYENAERAVDEAIARNSNDSKFGKDIEEAAEIIYGDNAYWP